MEVFNLARELSYVKYEFDPYVEMYYYDKVTEKELNQDVRTVKEAQFMSFTQKQQIAASQKKSKLSSLLYAASRIVLHRGERRPLRREGEVVHPCRVQSQGSCDVFRSA